MQTHLSASTVDSLRQLLAYTVAVNSEDGRYDPPPLIPRPNDAERIEAERRHEAVERAAVLRRVREIESIVLPDRG